VTLHAMTVTQAFSSSISRTSSAGTSAPIPLGDATSGGWFAAAGAARPDLSPGAKPVLMPYTAVAIRSLQALVQVAVSPASRGGGLRH
jgi:hypothetical protein